MKNCRGFFAAVSTRRIRCEGLARCIAAPAEPRLVAGYLLRLEDYIEHQRDVLGSMLSPSELFNQMQEAGVAGIVVSERTPIFGAHVESARTRQLHA